MKRDFEFYTKTKKREKIKLSLWIEKETMKKLERARPSDITTQECIRQILNDYLSDDSE
jgi:hypothetical protein